MENQHSPRHSDRRRSHPTSELKPTNSGHTEHSPSVTASAGKTTDPDPDYVQAALNAAAARTYRAAVNFQLSAADREDLHHELILDLLERADRFDPEKGSAGTFTGLVAENGTNDFLNGLRKDRARLSFASDTEAANDPDINIDAVATNDSVVPLWAEDRDLFCDSAALRDLETAIAYMSEVQVALFDLLECHQDLPSACKASGISSATFYRRVADLQMHLRMFGFRTAA
jgi:DNA-directed RNA polymerase specialized sigma24 family protein